MVLLAAGLTHPAAAQRPPSPFVVRASFAAAERTVSLEFQVPSEHVIYADRLKVELEDGEALTFQTQPPPVLAVDKYSGKEKQLFNQAFVARVPLGPQLKLPLNLTVKFQGCSNSACYFPEKQQFQVTAQGLMAITGEVSQAASTTRSGWEAELANFKVAGRETGYQGKQELLKFLDRAASGAAEDQTLEKLKQLSLPATVGIIALGGAGLNLTPCVLPMIPINLAIIGAGARASSRRRGFLLGAIYGAGMALVYGVLGLVVVLTGSKFGALNASPWFNVGIAVIFGVMALGMFDLVNIDFSRFRGGAGGSTGGAASPRSQFALAFGMGCVAALLAGACVAPVVISVLLLATHLFSQGTMAGLLLPFLLGLGMALPWPFAGAGLSFLPKPGKWMVRVKYAFGVLILGFAVYYAHLGYGLFQHARRSSALAAAPARGASSTGATDALATALREAREQGKPVFIDFWASWCKNCLAMEETVFNQAEIQTRLKPYVVIKFQAEQPNEAPARQVMDRFGVIGLPTYVALLPAKQK